MDPLDFQPQFPGEDFLPLDGAGNSSSSNFRKNGPISSNFTTFESPFSNSLVNSYPSGSSFSCPQLNIHKYPRNSPGSSRMTGARRKRLQKFLKQGIPYDEARILCLNPVFQGPSQSSQPVDLFQNSHSGFKGDGPFDDFQNFVQFSMENVGLIPRSTEYPRRRSLSSLMSLSNNNFSNNLPKRKRKKKKSKNADPPGNIPNSNNQSQITGDRILTQAERKRAKNARRRLRLRNEKLLKNCQSNKPQTQNSQSPEKNPPLKCETETLAPTNNGVHQPEDQSSQEDKQKQKIKTEISVGIIPVDYPQNLFSSEQLSAIQKEILAKVALQKTETVKPHFKGVKIENGVMIVHCADEESASWLKGLECSLGLQSETNLKIVDEIPETVTINAYFPESREDSTEFILELISGQNEDLNVDEWKVVERKEEEGNSVLILAVDGASADKIKAKQQINYKFGFARFISTKEDETVK